MTGAILVFAVLLGLIPATIASKKGGSFLFFWIFGALLFIVALPVALMVKGHRCPWCAERIQPTASVCPHCHRDLAAVEAV